MSADALYRQMGLEGYQVEDTWEGKDGAGQEKGISPIKYWLVATFALEERCSNVFQILDLSPFHH